MICERMDSREGFDQQEYEAYLDGGVVGLAEFEFEQANLELSQVGQSVTLIQSIIEAREMQGISPLSSLDFPELAYIM